MAKAPANTPAPASDWKTDLPFISVRFAGGDVRYPQRWVATLAPAIRIAVVGVGKNYRYNDGRWVLPVRFAAVIITRDAISGAEKIDRDAAAVALAGATMMAVASNRFGLEGVLQPENLDARSEYSGAIDKLGVALWQVNWTSGLLAGETADDAIAALSQLWINGVRLDTGEEILPAFATGAPEIEGCWP